MVLPPFIKQTWTSSAVLMNMMGVGMIMGYTSSLLPALKAPDSPIKIDLKTTSWISSSIGISSMLGILAASYLMQARGRRLAYIVALLPGILCWPIIYYATNVPLLIVGRVLGGFTCGGSIVVGSVSIGEYSSPQNRGTFLNLKTAMVCIGSTTVHALGHFYNWRTLALISMVPPIIALAIICTWVESPAWLATRGRFEECEKHFLWLRGDNELTRKELRELIKTQKENPRVELNLKESTLRFLKKFIKKDFLKPVFIMIVGSFLLEFSGRHIFPAYAADIVLDVVGDKSNAFYYTLAIDIIISVSATISSVIVKVVKRRNMLFSTGLASVLVLFSVCVYLYLTDMGIVLKDRIWIPIMLWVLYFILANLGCTPIPIAFLGEIFPLEHRSTGIFVSGLLLALCLNIGLLVTPYLMATIKVYGAFAVFGLITSLCLCILYFILPETKDRSLVEIENYFKYGKYEGKSTDDEANEKLLLELKSEKGGYL